MVKKAPSILLKLVPKLQPIINLISVRETKQVIKLRLNNLSPDSLKSAYSEASGNPFGSHFDKVMSSKKKECDEFYDSITPPGVDKDSANVMRQALAGMLWSKQYYGYDIERWLQQHGIKETQPTWHAEHRGNI